MARRMTSLIGALALVSGATAATAAPSSAATAAAGMGGTRVAVAPALATYLGQAGIVPSTVGPANAKMYKGTLAVRFPIAGMANGGDRIKHVGGVALTGDHDRIALKRFWIDVKRGKVSGRVNGSIGDVGRVDLFRLAKSQRPKLGAIRLVLTRAAAGALNQTFDVNRFDAGDNFGFATVKPGS